MFRGMGSRLPSDKAIKLLDYRGEKELARTLRCCWLELDVHDSGSFVNSFIATVQVHAPLKEYEHLRNLPSSARQTLLKIFTELYSPDDLEIVDIGFVLEIEDQTQDQLVAAIEEQKSLMISVGTGERRIQDANEEYKKRRNEIGGMLKGKGIKDPNPFFDLWGWYKRFKSGDLPTYASRRQFMSELYDPLLARLQQDGSSKPGMFDEPTGWAKVDRTVTEIRQRLEQASTEEQFQAVGTLCREALISLAQAVFDSAQHPTLDGVKASPTDFKRMIEAYIAVELAGASKEASRRHAKAAFDLANDLQHKRTADFRHAALCAEATVAVINLIAIVSGQRDP
jgi:hypothetical protein